MSLAQHVGVSRWLVWSFAMVFVYHLPSHVRAMQIFRVYSDLDLIREACGFRRS